MTRSRSKVELKGQETPQKPEGSQQGLGWTSGSELVLPQFPFQPFPCHGYSSSNLPDDKSLPKRRKAELQLHATREGLRGAAAVTGSSRRQLLQAEMLPGLLEAPCGGPALCNPFSTWHHSEGLFLKGMQLSQKPNFEVWFKALLLVKRKGFFF